MALILAEAAGANPKAVRQAIKNGFAGSPILEIHGKRILEKNFKAGGKCSTQLKDMNNIIETAKTFNISLPLSEKIKKFHKKLLDEGKFSLDHSALYLLIKKMKKIFKRLFKEKINFTKSIINKILKDKKNPAL
tara:strand:- start:815 stop:1216 length:402 start_codon:yes stop_codon:yes gene_type:complete